LENAVGAKGRDRKVNTLEALGVIYTPIITQPPYNRYCYGIGRKQQIVADCGSKGQAVAVT